MPQTDTDDRREIAPARLPEAYAHCAELVREQDQDRYIAGLYAPEDRRAALYALYAFSLEIARVRALVSEPLPGEVKIKVSERCLGFLVPPIPFEPQAVCQSTLLLGVADIGSHLCLK